MPAIRRVHTIQSYKLSSNQLGNVLGQMVNNISASMKFQFIVLPNWVLPFISPT